MNQRVSQDNSHIIVLMKQAVLTIGLLLALSPLTGWSADQMASDNVELRAERCISLTRINRTSILDNQNILFHMNGGKIFKNHLPNRCPGLSKNDAYTYRTSLSRLCNLDFITILNSHGSGFMRGASCGLGKFEPVTKEQVTLLKKEIAEAKKKKSSKTEKES